MAVSSGQGRHCPGPSGEQALPACCVPAPGPAWLQGAQVGEPSGCAAGPGLPVSKCPQQCSQQSYAGLWGRGNVVPQGEGTCRLLLVIKILSAALSLPFFLSPLPWMTHGPSCWSLQVSMSHMQGISYMSWELGNK